MSGDFIAGLIVGGSVFLFVGLIAGYIVGEKETRFWMRAEYYREKSQERKR